MKNYEYLIKYKIGVFMSIILLLLGRHAYAIAMAGKEGILAGGNIGGMLDPVVANIIISGNMPANNTLGGPLIAPPGLVALPLMNGPAASVTGADLIGGMYNIIPGITGGQVMPPVISPVMGQSALSLYGGMPLIANMLVSGIICPSSINPLMMGPDPTNPLIIWPGPMCPFSMVSDLMHPFIMFPCPVSPFMLSPCPMNSMINMSPCPICLFMPGPTPMNNMIIPGLMSYFGINPYNIAALIEYLSGIRINDDPEENKPDHIEEPGETETEDCRSRTIYKDVKKGNITFLEVSDGCTGMIYHGYPSGIWLPAALGASSQPITDYSWWYGCSATCAGMMMAYYDRYPYYVDGNIYDLIPGGVAEYESFLNPDPWYLADVFSNELVKLCNNAIASKKHALDFWANPTNPSASFQSTGDPLASIRNGNPAGFDCLADFMGTSQDNLSGSRGNPDGITWFWFPSDGSILSSDPVSWPSWYDYNYSGMYGLVEWARYCQTISGQSMNAYAYNQYIEGYTPPNGPAPGTGFSFYDYQNEIDKGRPVMFLLVDWTRNAGHSVLGVGYGYNSDTGQGEVYIHDTWTMNNPADPKKIPWINSAFSYSVTISGTLYTFSFELMGVTIFHPNKPLI
ncbi:MAG: C39 family peptidase [bacterium]